MRQGVPYRTAVPANPCTHLDCCFASNVLCGGGRGEQLLSLLLQGPEPQSPGRAWQSCSRLNNGDTSTGVAVLIKLGRTFNLAPLPAKKLQGLAEALFLLLRPALPDLSYRIWLADLHGRAGRAPRGEPRLVLSPLTRLTPAAGMNVFHVDNTSNKGLSRCWAPLAAAEQPTLRPGNKVSQGFM